MVTWKDYQVERSRRQDMLEEAERERALYSAGLKISPVADWSRARLVRLGAWLEQLGCRLQHRYSRQSKLKVTLLPTIEEASGGC
jgi:hypothetical protein